MQYRELEIQEMRSYFISFAQKRLEAEKPYLAFAVKVNNEYYFFYAEPERRTELVSIFKSFAENPELNFSFSHAESLIDILHDAQPFSIEH